MCFFKVTFEIILVQFETFSEGFICSLYDLSLIVAFVHFAIFLKELHMLFKTIHIPLFGMSENQVSFESSFLNYNYHFNCFLKRSWRKIRIAI